MRDRCLLAWSSGKDSAFSLALLRKQREVDVIGLLTTVNRAFSRVAMHAVRRTLVEAQARAAGLPLRVVEIPWPCSNAEYERAMQVALFTARDEEGVTVVAFGDLFLEDVRRYREERLAGTGLRPVFPLWGRPTRPLAEEMIGAGLKAKLTCIDPRKLDPSFAGREFDLDLLSALPEDVDPCGENGEFHSFAWAGPMFDREVRVLTGDQVERDGFVFVDLVAEAP